jgi:hypothetical protein
MPQIALLPLLEKFYSDEGIQAAEPTKNLGRVLNLHEIGMTSLLPSSLHFLLPYEDQSPEFMVDPPQMEIELGWQRRQRLSQGHPKAPLPSSVPLPGEKLMSVSCSTSEGEMPNHDSSSTSSDLNTEWEVLRL